MNSTLTIFSIPAKSNFNYIFNIAAGRSQFYNLFRNFAIFNVSEIIRLNL